MEHGLPWERAKQILDELLAALGSFDCRRSLSLLSEAVEGYPRLPKICDHVWLNKGTLGVADDERKVMDLSAKRRPADAGASHASEAAPRAL
jgi:hypothetical protein